VDVWIGAQSDSFEELAMPLFDQLYNFAHWLTHNRHRTFSCSPPTAAAPLQCYHPEQLAEIANTYFPQVAKAGATPGDYFDWRQQNASFSQLGAFTKTLQGLDLLGDGESRRTQ